MWSLRGQDQAQRCTRHLYMIPTKKSEHKCLRIEESRRTRKSHKIARKRHENHSSQEKEIDATTNASIQPEVRFSTKS
jgi:hypothetical protein